MVDGIQISQNLLFQLVGDDQKSTKKTKKSKQRTPREPQQSQKQVHQKPITNQSEAHKGIPSAGWPLQAPLILPTPQLPSSKSQELRAIQSVLKESESVLEKLQKHEENMVKEVTLRAKQLHEKEFKLPQQKTIICQIEKDSCLACYKEYVNDPLKCSTMVRSYQDCVRRARKQSSAPSS